MRRQFLALAWLVARRDYLRTVRRRGFIVGTALLPLAFALYLGFSLLAASGLGSGGDPGQIASIELVDEAGLGLQAEDGSAQVRIVDREEALRRLRSGTADAAYILGPEYLATGRVERVVLRGGGFDVAELEQRIIQEQRLAALLRRHLAVDGGLPSTAVERLVTPIAVQERALEGGPTAGPTALQFLVPYAFSTLFVISIFITSGYLLQSVTEEKENRVVEIVLSSVPALPLMSGKIVGLGAAGLTQVAVWLATALLGLPVMAGRAPGIEQARLGPEVVLPAICYFVLGYLAYGAIFSAIGALAPGTREAQQYSGFFGVFAVVPLIFTAAFLSDIGSPIVTALSLFPLTAPAAVLQVLVLADEPPWLLVGLSLSVLAAFTALATLASARVFRATLLLYGMRPSLRQVAAAVLARS